MKFTITVKNPDTIDQSLIEENILDDNGNVLNEEAMQLVNKFVEYSEYVFIEFDTVKGTATVLRK